MAGLEKEKEWEGRGRPPSSFLLPPGRTGRIGAAGGEARGSGT